MEREDEMERGRERRAERAAARGEEREKMYLLPSSGFLGFLGRVEGGLGPMVDLLLPLRRVEREADWRTGLRGGTGEGGPLVDLDLVGDFGDFGDLGDPNEFPEFIPESSVRFIRVFKTGPPGVGVTTGPSGVDSEGSESNGFPPPRVPFPSDGILSDDFPRRALRRDGISSAGSLVLPLTSLARSGEDSRDLIFLGDRGEPERESEGGRERSGEESRDRSRRLG
jgi:hypothetical protein